MSNNRHTLKPEGFRLNNKKYLLLMRAVKQSPALEIFKTGLDKALSSLRAGSVLSRGLD